MTEIQAWILIGLAGGGFWALCGILDKVTIILRRIDGYFEWTDRQRDK